MKLLKTLLIVLLFTIVIPVIMTYCIVCFPKLAICIFGILFVIGIVLIIEAIYRIL